MADERLHSPERLGERDEAERAEECAVVLAVRKLERDHRAAVLRLLELDGVSREVLESRIPHAGDVRVRRESRRNRFGIGDMPVHAHAQGLDAAYEQERVERAEDAACRILDERKALGDFRVVRDGESGHEITVPSEVLCGGMHHDVRAERDWSLEIRCHERVINNREEPAALCDERNRRKVGDREERIRGRFHEDGLDARRDCGIQRRHVVGVRKRVAESKRLEHLVENAEGSTVDVLRDEHFIARPEERENGCDCRHAGAEGEAARAAFQVGDQRFKRGPRGISGTGVFPACVFAECALAVGGCLVDGHVHGAGCRVAVDAAMDEQS